MDTIRVEGLTVDCVVGVYPHERTSVQPLRVDLELALDTETAAVEERVRSSVNYAAISSQLVFLLRSCRFRLLETAAHALASYVLAPPAAGERRAQVDRARIRLSKPGALSGFAVPSLEIERSAEWCRLVVQERSFGTVDVVHETQDAGIYRLNVAPGRTIPLHVHRQMRQTEMMLSGGLHCQGRPAPAGAVFRWPLDAPHTYHNPTERGQTILCVTEPPFIEADQIEVDGVPADVSPEPPWGLFGA